MTILLLFWRLLTGAPEPLRQSDEPFCLDARWHSFCYKEPVEC